MDPGATIQAERSLWAAELAVLTLLGEYITNPLVTTVLVALGLLLLAADVVIGGVGWLSVIGTGLLALLLWGHAQVGAPVWAGAALMLLGLVLLAIEALLIPGVGVAGLLGIGALLGGIFVTLAGDATSVAALTRAGWMLLASIFLALGGLALLLRAIPESRLLRGVVLHAKVGATDALRRPGPILRWLGGARLAPLGGPDEHASERLSLVGAVGRARSALRPAGVAEIRGRQHEVTTGGAYVGAGEAIEVVRDDGARLIVRRTDQSTHEDVGRE